MEGWINTWIVQPHSFDDPTSWVTIPAEFLFISFALGDFSRRKFHSAGKSLFVAALFYLFARFG